MSCKEADFVVLDRSATPLIEFRLGKSESVIEDLFVFSMLGDDRVVKQTWSAGLKYMTETLILVSMTRLSSLEFDPMVVT